MAVTDVIDVLSDMLCNQLSRQTFHDKKRRKKKHLKRERTRLELEGLCELTLTATPS